MIDEFPQRGRCDVPRLTNALRTHVGRAADHVTAIRFDRARRRAFLDLQCVFEGLQMEPTSQRALLSFLLRSVWCFRHRRDRDAWTSS